MKGSVYLFRQTGTNYVKIGMTESDSIESRFGSFKMYSPNGAEILGFIATDTPRKLEKEIHDRFRHKRLKGEFFDLLQNECDQILETYSGIREKELNTYFQLLITDSTVTIEQIVQVIKKIRRKPYEKNTDLEDKIIEFIEANFKGKKITGTDARSLMLNMWEPEDLPSFKILGMAMKTKWECKIKKVNGKTTKLYYIT